MTSHSENPVPPARSEMISAGDLDFHGGIEGEAGEKLVLGGGKNRDETEMDMTPMVDVTFLLLIFFMVTAAFTAQRSLPVPTPKPDEPSTAAVPKEEQDPSSVTIIIDSLNTYRIITNDWEAEAPSEQEMRIKIRDAGQGDSTGTRPEKALIKAHVDAMHSRVVAAMDAVADAKIGSIQYMVIEEDE